MLKNVTAVSLLLVLSRLPLFINANPTVPKLAVGAVYAMTNAPTGNFILSAAIGIDGKLTLGTAISTKGIGSFQTGTQTDPLASQDALYLAGDRLYAVNPGSNTISTFSINVFNPTELTLIGEPVSSGGEFPVSLAASPRTGQICVLNAGKINGVNCYRPDATHGLVEIPGTHRLLHRNVTTPPAGFNGVPSQVTFSRDGSALYAGVRGTPNSADLSFIAAWAVNLNTGALSDDSVKSFAPAGVGAPFGLTLIEGTSSLLVTDALTGFDIFQFDTPTAVGKSTPFAVPGQVAICWVRFSSQTGNYYFADLTTGQLTEVHIDQHLQSTIVRQYPQGVNATIDEQQIGTVLGKDYLYLLASGTTSIYVLALEGAGNANTIQHLDLGPLAKNGVVIETHFLQGIAIYTGI